MAQNIDDFFKKKIENIEDTLPEASKIDEAVLWANIQQDLRKPKPFAWYWVSTVAACLVALVSWWFLPHPTLPEGEDSYTMTIASIDEKKEEKPMIIKEKNKIIDVENRKKAPSLKKNKSVISQKLDFKVENIASKGFDFREKEKQILPDSISFKSNISFEKKASLNIKTVHINEISKYDDAPYKQPRFKVQFAGTLFEKNESINNDFIKTPSIRIQ
jgi:hypothetical protein